MRERPSLTQIVGQRCTVGSEYPFSFLLFNRSFIKLTSNGYLLITG